MQMFPKFVACVLRLNCMKTVSSNNNYYCLNVLYT